ncbi:MAG TPA: hypothetical protein DCE41_18145 [Cytophagales bacterium]|nr:hypothetical protein [Cytophagales bacterium]HAA21754.1 hypothetical protein [Cytophagales bacterium]HAP60045.1 hypothetical protein [Cytophagales bacterium]
MRKLGLIIGLLGLILCPAAWAQQAEQVAWFQERAEEWEGTAFPEFAMLDQDGNPITHGALENEVTVIRFFFTGCPPCREETNQLNGLYNRYHPRGVNFLAFSFDPDTRTRMFREWKKYRYRVVPDAKRFIQNDMHVGVYPTHMVVNPKGQVTSVILGTDLFIGWKLRWAIYKARRQ